MDQLLKAIAATSRKPLADKGELAELRRLQASWVKARDAANGFTYIQAREAWLEHQKDLGAKMAAGESLGHLDAWTRADYESDFESKLAAARGEMNRLNREATPIAAKIIERFCEVANDLAVEVEKQEAEKHREFAIPYQPSQLVVQLKKAAEHARRRLPSTNLSTNSPISILPFIDLE
jgi:hypothetical protein